MRKVTVNKGQRRRRETLDRQVSELKTEVDGKITTVRAVFCPLCGRFIHESSWSVMAMEDAPPRQYDGSRERCLTCKACNNGPGGSFETRTSRLNLERNAAINRASRVNPLFTPAGEALRLAKVSEDEKLLEIKSSYIIAFATLGVAYAIGPGLNQVRELIAGGTLGNVATCATLPAAQIPAGDRVLVARAPIECVLVTHPTHHSRRPGVRHVVFLPMPNSAPGFYNRLDLLANSMNWQFVESHEQPGTRRLPRLWDRVESEHACREVQEFDIGLLEGEALPWLSAEPDSPTG